jgi:hypothetical protein
MNGALAALLFLSVAAADAVEWRTPHLVPYSPMRWGESNTYEAAVREVLLRPLSDRPYARAITLPSFDSEWVIDVAEPKAGKATVNLLEAETQIWKVHVERGDTKAIEPAVASTRIDAAIAEQIRAAFLRELYRVAYPKPNPDEADIVVADGVVYHFAASDWRVGTMHGEVHEPSTGSGPAEITDLALLLRDLAKAQPSGRADIIAKLRVRLGVDAER